MKRVLWLGLLALLGMGGPAGCAKGTHLGWDAAGMTWDPAPPRNVVDPDGGVAVGVGPGGGGIGSGYTTVCAVQDQANCCYDGQKVSGVPQCGWRGLARGETASITTAYRDNQKVTLPVALQLHAEIPANFASYEDCVHGPLGFVIKGPGLKEEPLSGNISHYDLKPDRTWRYTGGGGQIGLVAAENTEVTGRDGSQPLPTYRLSEGLCKPLREADAVALIQFFDQIDFTLDGVDYRADFDTHPNEGGRVTGYYVVVEKAF